MQESRAALVRTAAVRTAASHEGDGIYAVGLVLAGGAALALTGQVLRMRRRRKGSDDGDAG
ncbi:Sortase OS=Streptomyces rimosus subsp. rimosus (strain ATCC / DSM 40260 / JCM 4667 / NRRL 2234)OX=1265868 GN=SRIM_014965 PE=4 SV=1 [Streptomyces rimosus subsp. rimosus]